MLEITSTRKSRINLADYPYRSDIENRICLSDMTVFDVRVLQEILFNPLKISCKKLCRSLDCSEKELLVTLKKIEPTGLLQQEEDVVLVDKEKRKYFEIQLCRFEDDFQPNIDFLQTLLRQIPIQYLPTWYTIPRSSNNIFDSIVEKYLITPHAYQRYLSELSFSDPRLTGIMNDVLESTEFRVSSSDLITKYNLSRSDFEEIMLQLEFHFVSFVGYVQEEDHWNEYVFALHEWSSYHRFLEKVSPPVIETPSQILRHRPNDFAFVEDISAVLSLIRKKSVRICSPKEKALDDLALLELTKCTQVRFSSAEEKTFARIYFEHLLKKLCQVKLCSDETEYLSITDNAKDFLELTVENRALYLYRHPANILLSPNVDLNLFNERNIREAEKSIRRVIHGGWVRFDDFIHSVTVSFCERLSMALKKTGRHWEYSRPEYTSEEINFIKATIFEHLFECGFVATGSLNGEDSFCITAFGQFFFNE